MRHFISGIRVVCAILSAGCLLTLVALKLDENQPRVSVAQKADLPVYPALAAKASIANLPDLVASLLPKGSFDRIGWTFAEDNPFIAWQTVGVSSEGSRTFREGYARVRVAGKSSTVLRANLEELAWTVTLGSTSSEKFGPEFIEISPGAFSHDQCFGTLYTGCSFASGDAVKGAGLIVREICRTGMPGNGTDVYAVAANGSPESLVIVEQNSGSGGETSNLHIAPMTARESACKAS